AWVLELKAKTSNASYDKVKIWMKKADMLPVKGEYYTASGKLLRKAEFSDVKNFDGVVRPSKIVMRNMLAVQRWSVMAWESLNTKVNPPATKFVLDDLGK
ncbi:MAG: outer membrane lipoprotein-sorting protein, partial [Deltaproteobacteria bacterium]|nr:outer membrane lipoprotein-sorting protein [Deltaproteobacteria bacterium]